MKLRCGAVLSFCLLWTSTGLAETLTREDAVRRALEWNPAVAAAERRAEAAELAARGAGRWSNPDLSVEFENVGGDARGTSAMETTARLSQEIALGGENGALRNAARHAARKVGAERDRIRAELVAGVRAAFDRALIAASRDSLGQEARFLADSALSVVRSRVRAGEVPPAEESRARAASGRVWNEAERRQAERLATVRRLRAFWGDTLSGPAVLEGRIDFARDPGLDALTARLESSPAFRAAESAARAADSRVDVERGERIPDLTVAAGARRNAGDDQDSFVFELSMPLPLFDRRGAAIGSARAEAAAVERDGGALRLELHDRLNTAHQALTGARRRLERLEREILPGAEEAHAAILAGYESGKFGYLDLAEARRDWIAGRLERLETLDEIVSARLELESLIGGSLDR